MSIVRRGSAIFVATLLATLAALPISAMRCETRRVCPMMAMTARGVAPCHGPSGRAAQDMVAPMSCCATRLAAAPAPAAFAVAPAAATPMVDAGLAPAPAAAAVSEAWRGNRQALGLYTLHAAWRI